MSEPEPKGILDELDDLEAKRKQSKKKKPEKKDDLDIDRVW